MVDSSETGSSNRNTSLIYLPGISAYMKRKSAVSLALSHHKNYKNSKED